MIAPIAGGWFDAELADLKSAPLDADFEAPILPVLPDTLPVAAGLPTPEAVAAAADLQALVASAVRSLEAGEVEGIAGVPQRYLSTPHIEVDAAGVAAVGTWRELVTSLEHPCGWVVNRLHAEATLIDGSWHLESLYAQPLLSVAYGDGWRSGIVGVDSGEAIDVSSIEPIPATKPSLEVLDSIEAIRRVHTEYMAACDAHDPSRVIPLFVPDGLWETMDGSEVLNGTDEIRAAYDRDCNRLTFCIHFLGNERIEVAPGADRATAAWSYFEPATNRGELAVWTAGRYELSLVNTPDGWRYDHFRIEPRLAAPYDGGWRDAQMIPLP